MSEKEVDELIKSYVNWIEVNKWIVDGCPYEEHDEVLMNLNLMKKCENSFNSEPKGKSTDLSIRVTYRYVCLINNIKVELMILS